MPIQLLRTRSCLAATLLAAAVIALGCQRGEQVETYVVPKERAAVETVASVDGEPTDRMLVAIVPVGQQAWFFRVVGPLGPMDQAAAAIEKFFAGLRVADDGSRAEWQVPDGWTEEAGTGMRAATIRIPAGEAALEMSVIPLPWTGRPGELLDNVNRWRGQMQLAPVGEPALAGFTRELPAGDATITVLDLRGRFQDTMAPFAGRAASGAPAATGQPDLPPGHPPIASGAAPDGAARSAPFEFELPPGWTERPASGMRRAEFAIVDGLHEAIVTVFDFSTAAGPMITDPLENVNRWRHQELGLEPLEADELDDAVEELEISGRPAIYVEIVPDAPAPKATLAAMVTIGDQIWFFKMHGDRDLVATQPDKFKAFLRSVRFAGDEGARDGDR